MRTSLPLFGVGLFALGLYAFSFASEVPQGTLSGVILSKETGRPLPEVRVVARPVAAAEPKSATAASPGEPVTTRTDAAGQFRFRGIPAGNYELEPQTEAHVNTEMPAVVREADETRVRMELPGRDPFLNLHIHQRAYLPGEKPRLELHGFRQGDSLRLRLYSTRLQALLPAWGSDLARLLAPTATTSRPGTLPALQSRGISLAREWGFAVRKRDAEGVFYADEWVADVLPGLYLVTATGARTQAVGWLVVTDLALVTKSAGNTTLCYATHLKTGQPVPGVRVSQYRGERQAASGTTNAQGLVELRSAGTSGEEGSEGAFFGHRGDSVAFMRFYSGSEEVDRYRVHTYTDRPVYRPGHRVAFKGVARRRHGADYSLPDVRFVELRVLGPQETEIYTASVPVNPRGSFAGEFTIPTEAAAGLYSLEVEIAGEVHENTLAIASYRKPEWSVEVKTSADHFVRGDRVPVEIWANYYFGSPVVGGKVTYTLFRDRYWSWWDEEEAYLGPDDVEEGASGEVVDSGELTTDSAGVAKLELATAGTPEEEPGATYTYRIEAEVSDQSERTASGSAQYRVSAGAFSLDVRPESSVAAPGKTMTVEARLLDLADKPVSGVTLSATARLERWERNKLVPEELGRASAATGKDGRAKLAFTLPRTGLVVVTVEARDPRGNPVRETTDIWVTSDAGGDYGVKYPDLAVLLDKKQYAPGENAQVLLNTSKPGGTALLAVEAERVLEYRLVPLKSKSTVVRIPVLHSYLPNVFVHAALVRDGELATSERRLTVRSDAHRLNVTVESDREEYRPGDEATFRVRTTDRAGRPVSAEFSLGVVDEAVYAIRKEPSRGLWETFYPVRQNEVATGFSYPAIYLGDADKAGSNMAVRRNFQDTAHWEPFAKTDTAGRAEVRVRLPDNLTTWRATAVACSMDTQIGKAVDTILVKRELTVRLQTPRAFTEGDQTRVTAVVHNESAGPLDVEVNLKATGLTVEGNPQRSVRVAPGKAEPLAWETRITGPVGPGSRAVVTVSASAGTLADGMELTVPIRPFRREQITGVSGVSRGESVAETIARDAAAVDGELEVRMAPSLAGSLLGALEYLTGYPYGCTEQTMSRFLPDVLVEKALRELELRRPELQAALPAMTQAGLMRLYRFQQSSGGWGWWQYGTDPDPWMTAYVLFGLQEAKAAGVAVNPRVYDSGVSALEGLFQGPTAKADERMFAAWVLARAGRKAMAARLLAGVEKIRGKLELRSVGYAILGLAELKERERAAGLLAAVWKEAKQTPAGAYWEETRPGWWYSGPQDGESTALLLKATLALSPDDERTAQVVRWLLGRRQGRAWVSTRDTAWILLALTDYLKVSRELQSSGSVTVLLNGRAVATESLGGGPELLDEKVVRIPVRELTDQNRLELRTEGDVRLYWSATLRQQLQAPTFPAESSAPGLRIRREYFRLASRRNAAGAPEVAPEGAATTRFRVGERVLVRVTVNTDQPLEYLVVEDPLPAGLEVQDRGDVDPWEWSYWWSSMDVRDDRVALFVRDMWKGEHVLEYYARPELAGKLRALPAKLEDMYAPTTRANSTDTTLEVTP